MTAITKNSNQLQATVHFASSTKKIMAANNDSKFQIFGQCHYHQVTWSESKEHLSMNIFQ